MLIIHYTDNVIDQLMAFTEAFCIRHQLPYKQTPDHYRELAWSVYQEELKVRMVWANMYQSEVQNEGNFKWVTNGGLDVRGVETMLCYVLPWWVPGAHAGLDVHELNELEITPEFYQLHHRYVREVLDVVTDDAERFLNGTVGEVTWRIWVLRDIDGCLGLVKGRDYRVVDWERRKANGEFNEYGTFKH